MPKNPLVGFNGETIIIVEKNKLQLWMRNDEESDLIKCGLMDAPLGIKSF